MKLLHDPGGVSVFLLVYLILAAGEIIMTQEGRDGDGDRVSEDK